MIPRPLRIAGLTLLALAALAALAAAADARTAYVATGDTCGSRLAKETSRVYMDSERMYAGFFDGTIVAVDRTSGLTSWQYPVEHGASTTEMVTDMFGDDQRIYASIYNSAGPSPVVALDKATGTKLWIQTDFEANPVHLTGDGNFLYVGMPGGVIAKLSKETGDIQQPLFRPRAFIDANGVETVNSTYAMSARNGVLWAARNFGPLAGGEAAGMNYRHTNHTLIRVRTSDMVGEEYRFPNLGRDPPGNGPFVYPSTVALWVGPDTDANGANIVYASTITHNGNPPEDGLIIAFSAAGPETAANFGTQNAAPAVITPLDGVAMNNNANYGGVAMTGLNLGGLTFFSSIHGDGTNIYLGLNAAYYYAEDVQTGGVARISPRASGMNLVPWTRPGAADDVRFTDWFRVADVYAEPGAGGSIAVGHGCFIPGEKNQLGPHSALLLEMPKNDDPTVVIMSPLGGDMLPGSGVIALKTDYPNAPADRLLKVDFYISSVNGACDDGASCYTRLSPHPTDDLIPANTYYYWYGVEFNYPEFCDPAALEACEYRFKVVVTDVVNGRTASDLAEGPVFVDKTPPIIHQVLPAPHTVLKNEQNKTIAKVKLVVDVADSLSGLDTDRTQFCYDLAKGGTCISGADARAAGFYSNAFFYRNNGFDAYPKRFTQSQGEFTDGPHTFRVDVWDLAGNVASKTWDIVIDRGIASAKQPLSPAPGSWVHERRPIFMAQFWETVQIKKVEFNGANILSQVEILPTDPVENPLGTRVIYQPRDPLPVGVVHEFLIDVTDEHGNIDARAPFLTSVKIDAEPPQFSGLLPPPASLLTEEKPQIVFSVDDRGSRIDETSLSVFVDGKDVSERLERRPGNFWVYRPEVAFAGGKHTVTAAIVDAAGNLATTEWDFSVDLTAPKVDVTVELPPDQRAVKKGDQVSIRVHVTDDSEIRNVRVNARGLDPKLSTARAPTPVPGQPGTYEMVVTVNEIRSRPAVEVAATAEDVGGHVGYRNTTVHLDNVPPEARLKELPAFVGAAFTLEWEEKAKDLGSGVAFYRLERQENNQEWKVIRPRLNGTSLSLTYAEGQFTALRFRISAIDAAGNVQSLPSNVVSTVVRGDPFAATNFNKNLIIGQEQEFSATPLEALSLDNVAVSFVFTGPNNVSVKKDMEQLGRLYKAYWNVSGVAPGDYILQYQFRDKDGFEMLSVPHAVKVVPVDFEDVGGALGEKAESLPSPAFFLILLAVVAGVARLRRTVEGGRVR